MKLYGKSPHILKIKSDISTQDSPTLVITLSLDRKVNHLFKNLWLLKEAEQTR